MESALATDRKMRGISVKIFRSCEEQYHHYCDSAMNERSERSSASMPSAYVMPKINPIHVCVRGIPWKTKPTDVTSFFEGVNIIGGVNGINIQRKVDRGALEATFFVNSREELKKALSYNRKCFDSRKIHGS